MDYAKIVNKLIAKGITIGSAESLTGGLFASTISSVPGVSAVYKGSVVSYSTLIKESVLGIPHSDVEKYGVVSSQIAYSMAKNVQKLLEVDMAISFTGNAGPSAMEGKPVGLVYLGIAYQGQISTLELHLEGNRNQIRTKCVEEAFKLINQKII